MPLAVLCDLLSIFVQLADKQLFSPISHLRDLQSGVYSLPWADDDKFWRTFTLWSFI
jgi:hypothetical protein